VNAEPVAGPVLVVTNDFPPRIGGIETFVAAACAMLAEQPSKGPTPAVVVLTASQPGSDTFDRTVPFPVVRTDRMLLPTGATRRAAVRLLTGYGCTRVLFGAAAPLSLLAPALRTAGAERIVALSHGHETWWATLPGARSLLRQMVAGVDRLGVISTFTADRIGAVLPQSDRAKLIRIPPPVDAAFFAVTRPERPARRCLAAGRLIRQKGFDTLLEAWRLSRPDDEAELVIVGAGPQRRSLERQADRLGRSVRFAGPVPHDRMPGLMADADMFALPVRTRLAGLNPEGLGLVCAEAAAAGLPVVVGESGGTAETVRAGETGWLVPPADPAALAVRLQEMIADPARARLMGEAGRRHAADRFCHALVRAALLTALG